MNVLVMFAKHWLPGSVKTRLAATWGDAAAGQIYLACLRCLLSRFAASADQRRLAFTPPESRREFLELAGNHWPLIAQPPGDLGQRMAAVMQQSFVDGARRVALIGSDAPLLPPEHVQQAFDLLQRFSVVLTPALDGGYALLAARDTVPPIFENIPWSTDQVYHQTIAYLDRAGLSYSVLPLCYDIDTADDLQRLLHDLHHTTAPDLIALREELQRIVG